MISIPQAKEKNSDRLQRELREAIVSGTMKPGERLLRVKDLAEAYQITYGQAQRAIKRLEKEGLLITRRGDGTFVGYRQLVTAGEKKPQKSAGLLIGDRFFWSSSHERLGIDDVLRGMEKVVIEAGFWLSRVMAEEADACLAEPENANTPAVVLTTLPPPLQMRLRADALRGRSVIVLFGSPDDAEWSLACDADGAAGMRMGLQHLADLGHRRIAFVAWATEEEPWWQREREEAYRTWMTERSAEPCVFRLPNLHSSPKVEAATETDDRMISEMQKYGITAALCVNDIAAQRVYAACRRLRIAIPEALSLVGFDDQSWALREGITTLQRPNLLMGEILGEWLVRCQYPGSHACRGRLAFKPSLVARGSTAAAGR